jgi:hypothetical protein
MNSKGYDKYNKIVASLKNETGWNKARVKFFVSFIYALYKVQTVSFVKVSQAIDGNASHGSKLRRVQRFFAGFDMNSDLIARLVFALLPEKPPYHLSLDRTNWKFGKVNINILTISVCYMGVGIPLMWTLLPKQGNSNWMERKRLLDRYISLFGTITIEALMADREFIGGKWFDELIVKNIPFHIRIKENLWIDVPGQGMKKAFWLFNHLKTGQALRYRKIVNLDGRLVYLSGIKSLVEGKYEFVIIASFKDSDDALDKYKLRWQIETMFRAMKTSGFNLEDTHLTEPERISKLLALLSVAFVWAYNVGIQKDSRVRPIVIKKHGRRQYSFFKYGLLHIANALLNGIDCEIINEVVVFLSCT